MEQNPELALAWQFIENTGTHLFLTGKAGTGKTTFLRRLKSESPKRMVVLAPTGIAAINAGGVTIYNPQIQISAESETKRSIFREKDKTKRSKKESAQHSKSRNKSFVMTSVSAL